MRPGFAPAYAPLEPEPLPQGDNGNSRIFAFVDDLFFQAKIQETARKLNVKVEFVKTEKDLLDHMKQNGEEKPSLIIFDMNNANAKPLTLIPKLKTKLKKGTSIIGFLSHVQGDLKMKAHEVGCDMVLPRSAFSQNLPQLLRRHGAPEAEADELDNLNVGASVPLVRGCDGSHASRSHLRSRNWARSSARRCDVTDSCTSGTLAPTYFYPGGHFKSPSSQQMHVQMKHRLAGARPYIQHRAIAIFDAALPRHPGCRQMAQADDLRIFGRCFLQAANVFLGNHQHMGRRLAD